MSKAPLIALLTDFGLVDPYAGILKAVINHIAPGLPIVDLTHEIPPGQILRAAIYLWQSRPFFPEETIFVCVVDPGVGSTRRGMLLQSYNQIFIGPDNGIFTFVMTPEAQVWELTNKDYMLPDQSETFHGRDVFAPIAAYTALGVEAKVIGVEMSQPVCLTAPYLMVTEEGHIAGETIYADRFGNVVTSLGRFVPQALDRFRIEPWIYQSSFKSNFSNLSLQDSYLELSSGKRLRWVRTFSDLATGECGYLIGSSGLIEIVAKGASAELLLKISEHEPVILNITSG
jgi:S-adenosylmethionine hydrolase